MPGPHLVVSRPPFREGIAPVAVAPLLGQPAFETGLFLRYPLPDFLRLAPDAAAAEAAARPFRELGVTSDVIGFDDLCAVPPPLVAETFGLTDHGILFVSGERDLLATPATMRLLVTWRAVGESRGAPVIGSKKEPEKGGAFMGHVAFAVAGPIGSALVGHLQKIKADLAKAKAARAAAKQKGGDEKRVADLYLVEGPTVSRVRLDQAELDYSGLGTAMRPESMPNWNSTLAELRRRAPGMGFNDDLIRVKPPPTTGKYLTVERVIDQASLKPYQIEYSTFYSAFLAWQVTREAVPVAEIDEEAIPEAELDERPAPPATPAAPKPSRPPGWGVMKS